MPNLLFSPLRTFIPDNNLPSAKTKISTGEGFALLGNGITFEGGFINVSSKRIEIGSLQQGQVKFALSPQWKFDYSQIKELGNISFENFSLLNLDGNKILEANIQGNFIELSNGSLILSRKTTDISSDFQQTINVNAGEQLLIRGTTSNNPPSDENVSRGITGIASENFMGEAININVLTKDLIIESGGIINTLTSSEGLSGNTDIESTNSIRISGFIPSNPVLGYSSIGSHSLEKANSSSIDINTKNLSITDGGAIVSIAFDSGNSGNIQIDTAESISINGFSRDNNIGLPSQITTTAFGSGNSGDANINATDLFILNGGAISTSSFSDATAGNININVEDSIILDGFSGGGLIEGFDLALSAITSFVSRLNLNIADAVPFPVASRNSLPTGNAGNISLNANNLRINNNATLTVQNDGTGNAGSIQIDTGSITLNKAGSITASTLSGLGGNVTLNTDQLQIKNNSLISTSAGGEGNGGNIEITTDSLLAVNNSDITAKAVRGNGGNITITTNAILGTEERKATANNGTSDIDASSQFGQDGTVTITNPQVLIQDPIIAAKEVELNDTDREIKGACLDRKNLLTDSRNIDIPESPEDLSSNPEFSPNDNFVPPETKEAPEPTSIESLLESLVWKPGDSFIPANHIVTTPDGQRFLVSKSQWENLLKTHECSNKGEKN